MGFHEDEYSLLKIYLKEWKAKSSHASPEDEQRGEMCPARYQNLLWGYSNEDSVISAIAYPC